MPVRAASGAIPDWDSLFSESQSEAGYFTTRQAAAHHIGTALLAHHLRAGRIQHAGRGVFRFSRFPPSPREELIPLWLWSDRAGVFSHETALSLLGLSDLAPTHVDLTLPASWAKRRLKVPPALVLHVGDVPEQERTSWGPLPVTHVIRTLNDCARAGTERQFLQQAVTEAFQRGLLLRADRSNLIEELHTFMPGRRR